MAHQGRESKKALKLRLQSNRSLVLTLAVTVMLTGCGVNVATHSAIGGSSTSPSNALTVESNSTFVMVGTVDIFSVKSMTGQVPAGVWSVLGGANNGLVDPDGTYHAPLAVPKPSAVSVCYIVDTNSYCNSITVRQPTAPVVLTPSQKMVTVGLTDLISATQDGAPASGGHWVVLGGSLNGTIERDGIYHAPAVVPSPANVVINYVEPPLFYSTTITVVPPGPEITSVQPKSLTQLSTPIELVGKNFNQSSVVSINGALMPTTFVDSSHLATTVTLQAPLSTTLAVMVQNTGTPATSSNTFALQAIFPSITVEPQILSVGSVTVTVTGSGFAEGDVVLLAGQPMRTTVNSATEITATGFLKPWLSRSVLIEVTATDGKTATEALNVPIAPTAVSFDAAARFTTQAAFGPRPDLVQHIQQVGFDSFINEQFQQPTITLSIAHAPHDYITAAISGNSLLRQRVAYALETFIVGTADDSSQSVMFLEDKLEKDAGGNFRQLLTDVASDANLGQFLNLIGDKASTNQLVEPNQNFAREVMQLFSIGPELLNDDGSLQLDSSGNPIPTYDQDMIVDMARAFTGWERPAIVNSADTVYGFDYSQPLAAKDSEHDHGSKLLFGTVSLPAGQTITEDRDAALDAIFAHPNLPPFVSKLLIQQLVSSNPSAAYIERISKVFEDDGTGTRGNMAAVVRAILLDTEARAGDTFPSPNDGFLQSPLKFEMFVMSALQDPGSDDQVVYICKNMGENWWASPTVFYFFSPSYTVPGTSVSSPEFMLFTNLSIIERSQILWGIVSSKQPGFTNDYKSGSWLFKNFPSVPEMIEALNHLLYHGQMSQDEQEAIKSYCSQLNANNVPLQLESAVFLALDADSYNVSQ